jgi:hypothetical protein
MQFFATRWTLVVVVVEVFDDAGLAERVHALVYRVRFVVVAPAQHAHEAIVEAFYGNFCRGHLLRIKSNEQQKCWSNSNSYIGKWT